MNILYLAQSETCHRICCKARRGFTFQVCDQSNQVYKNFSYFHIDIYTTVFLGTARQV